MYLEDLKVGDQVVLTQGNQYASYDCHTVTKATKTQITINNERFMRSTGNRLGDGNYPSSCQPFISRVSGFGGNKERRGHLTTWDEAKIENIEIENRNQRAELVLQIKKAAGKLSTRYESYDIDCLKLIAEKLESM